MADVISHRVKVVHIVPASDQDIMLPNYTMYALCLPCPCSGLPAHGCWLDTYCWTYTMPDSARTCTWTMVPLCGHKPQEEHQDQGGLRSWFHKGPCMWSMPPSSSVHIQECLPMVIILTPTSGFINWILFLKKLWEPRNQANGVGNLHLLLCPTNIIYFIRHQEQTTM